MLPANAVGGGRPRPESPQGSPAPSRGQRRRGSHGLEGPGRGPRNGGRDGPYLSLSAGCGCGAAREGPGASRPPGAGQAKSEERRARVADGELGPKLPARRAGLDAAAPGARGRSVSHTGGPAVQRLRQRQREPAPGRSRSPSGLRRRRRRGGATGSVTRSPGSSCGRGGARCGTGRIPASRRTAGSPATAARLPGSGANAAVRGH